MVESFNKLGVKKLMSKILMKHNQAYVYANSYWEEKPLNGKILTNCKKFIKFVNISPAVKILRHAVLYACIYICTKSF